MTNNEKNPLIKMVKEHFENAKKVRCLLDSRVYDITNITEDVHILTPYMWVDVETDTEECTVALYNTITGEWAEIVEYKKNINDLISFAEFVLNELPYRPHKVSESDIEKWRWEEAQKKIRNSFKKGAWYTLKGAPSLVQYEGYGRGFGFLRNGYSENILMSSMYDWMKVDTLKMLNDSIRS